MSNDKVTVTVLVESIFEEDISEWPEGTTKADILEEYRSDADELIGMVRDVGSMDILSVEVN